jgi:hypothetical protein
VRNTSGYRRYSSVFEAAEDREDTGVKDGILDWTHAAAISAVITLVITTDGIVIAHRDYPALDWVMSPNQM